MRTILIYGNDDILVTTRRLILERAGHRLFTTCFADAMLVLMTEPVEILLLCQSLKAEDRRGIVETAHAVRPDMKCTVLGVDGPDNDGSDGRVSMIGLTDQRLS